MQQQYYVDRLVSSVVIMEKKTPSQKEMVEVNFSDGTSEQMPKLRFELLARDKAIDATTATDIVRDHIAAVCFSALHEYGAKIGEVNGIVDAIVGLANNGITKANDTLWGTDKDNVTLIAVNEVLINARNKEGNDGTAPGGEGADSENKE